MNVVFNVESAEEKEIKFQDLKIGECFKSLVSGTYYIKICAATARNDGFINSLNLQNMNRMRVTSDTPVILYETIEITLKHPKKES